MRARSGRLEGGAQVQIKSWEIGADPYAESWGPVRKLSKGAYTGFVPSLKTGRPVGFESYLEFQHLVCWEADPSVITIWEQPLRVYYAYKKDDESDIVLLNEGDTAPRGYRTTTYVPDFLLKRRSPFGALYVLIQVKPESHLSKPDVIRANRAGSLLARTRAWEYQVVTDAIRATARFQNALLIIRYLRESPICPATSEMVMATLAQRKRLTFRRIARSSGLSETDALPICLALVGTGALSCDLDSPFGPDTVLVSAVGA